MKKLRVSFCIIISILTTTGIPASLNATNKKQQCEMCGKALALQEFFKVHLTQESLTEVTTAHSKQVKEYLENNCTNSDKEVEIAIAYCNKQSINTLLSFWSYMATTGYTHAPLNAQYIAEGWAKAAKALKARKPHSTVQ